MSKILNKFSSSIDKQWLSQLAWLFAGEGVSRVTRIIVAIVLSRCLTPVEFGLAALVLASDEFIRVFNNNGIGLKIIQASEEKLDETCQGVYKINWVMSVTLAALQMLLAAPIAAYFELPELTAMIQVLALTYFIYPFATVKVYRMQRRQDMRMTSLIFGMQVGLDNLLTASMALMGMGVWSVIIPKVLVAPLWVFCYYRADSWRFDSQRAAISIRQVWRFSRDVLAVEVLRAARFSWDRLLIGATLGIEALGIYFFAVNAGSGMAHSLIKAFNIAVIPRVCHGLRLVSASGSKRGSIKQDFSQAIASYSLYIVPLILLQLILAPWYVPIIFGEQWHSAISILMMLCGAVIFQGVVEVASQVLRAYNQTGLDLRIGMLISVSVLFAVIAGCQWSITWVAQLILLTQAVVTFAVATYVLNGADARALQTQHRAVENNNNNSLGATA